MAEVRICVCIEVLGDRDDQLVDLEPLRTLVYLPDADVKDPVQQTLRDELALLGYFDWEIDEKVKEVLEVLIEFSEVAVEEAHG